MVKNNNTIIFSTSNHVNGNNANTRKKKISNDLIRSNMIKNLKKAESLLSNDKFKDLQRDLILNLKNADTITVSIDSENNQYELKNMTGGDNEEVVIEANQQINDTNLLTDDGNKNIIEDNQYVDANDDANEFNNNIDKKTNTETEVVTEVVTENATEDKPFWKKMLGLNGGGDNIEEEDNDNEQTYMYDMDDSDDESEVSLIQSAKLKNKRYLNTLNVNSLRNIMKNNDIRLSKNGSYLRKNEMIKQIQKKFK